MRHILLAALLAAASPVIVGATNLEAEDVIVDREEWQALTAGRVVWYAINGRHWGREYFHRGRNIATFIAHDGTCMTAPWVEVDGIYCFAYTVTDCFHHVRRNGTLMVLPVDDGEPQTIERITDDGPLSCEPPLMM